MELEKLCLLDFIYNKEFISSKTFGYLEKIKSYFQDIQDFKTTMSYSENGIVTGGGDFSSSTEYIYSRSKNWIIFEKKAIKNNINIKLLEPLFTDIETRYYKKKYGEKQFKKILLEILKEINKLIKIG